MNDEDMSEIMQKINNMLNNSSDKDSSASDPNDVSSNSFNEDTLRNLIDNFTNTSFNDSSNNNSNNQFNFDINTILKMKNIMDKMNSQKNDSRSNLLLSLKPYLNDARKGKLEQYMQFLNISSVIEAFQSEGGVNNK